MEPHGWTHPCCDACWWRDHHSVMEDGSIAVQVPHRIKTEFGEWEVCCWCRQMTFSGIYVRRDPEELACGTGGG